MKGSVVLILIALSLAVSAALHSTRTTGTPDDNDIDRIGHSLEGVKPMLLHGAAIFFKGEPGQSAPYMQARYLIAPVALNIAPDGSQPDTLLTIQYLYSGDSALQQYIAGRKLLWQHTDDRYRYTLTINR